MTNKEAKLVGRAVLCPPPPANERAMVHHDVAHEGSLGSAPAPGAVLPSRGSAALAENIGRTEIFQAFLTVPRATAERGARSATPGAGVLPGTNAARTE